jgi:hypothetical protein
MLVLVCLKTVLILTQDRYTVCAERNIGSKIVLDAPDLLCDFGHVEYYFNPFGDSGSISARYYMVCVEHTIGSEIVLDAPDGTPR